MAQLKARGAAPLRIFLVGKTGQVGGHLAQLLERVGKTVAVSRETMDLADLDSVRAAIRDACPEVIVNAAGMTNVDKAEAEHDRLLAVNAVAPGVMAEEAKRLGALLVHFSSVYVFDGTSGRPYTEADAPNPINAYGRSKLAGEQAIAAAGAAALILRASWVYDVRGRNFVVTMLRLAAERDELRVVDDQAGSPAWARSLAEATAAILGDVSRAREAAGIYNVASFDAVTRYDFAARMLELARERHPSRGNSRLVRIKTDDFPLPARRPLNSVLDTSRLRSTFGVEVPDWETQLRACIALLGPEKPDRRRRARKLPAS